jgi:hypothetical protein
MYLYIFMDGSLAQSSSPPTPEDVQAIARGELTVLKFAQNSFLELVDATSWVAVQPAVVHESCSNRSYHWHQ